MDKLKKLFFQYDPDKTPLENAESRIKNSVIAAFFSSGVTLLVVILDEIGIKIIDEIGIYNLVDVIFLAVLAMVVWFAKSRVAAVILFLYCISDKIYMAVQNPERFASGIVATLSFVALYYCGVLGTFAYHKIKKEEKESEIEQENEDNFFDMASLYTD